MAPSEILIATVLAIGTVILLVGATGLVMEIIERVGAYRYRKSRRR